MTNPRQVSLLILLLTAASSLLALPVSAGQAARRPSVHGTRAVAAPAVARYHAVRRVAVSRGARVRVRPVPHVRTAEVRSQGPAVTVVPPIAPVVASPNIAAETTTRRSWGTSITASSAILTEASADAKIVKHVAAGTHIPDIIGEQNGYYQYIRWTHKIAYIAKSDVQLGSGAWVADASHGDEPTR